MGDAPSSGFGFGRDAFAAVVLAAALGDAGRFAAAAAQVIELGAAHVAAAHHLDRGDARRMQREDAFDALAVGDLAQRKVRVDAGVLSGDADALEGLDAFALALDDAQADLNGIARLERRHRPLGDQFSDLLGFELLQDVHRCTSSLAAPAALLIAAWRRHKSGRRCRVNRSAAAWRQAAIRAWSPDTSTSGTARPSHTCGRV